MKKIYMLLTLILLLLFLLRGYSNPLYERFESGNNTLYIFKADWCGHCKRAMPEFQKLATESPIKLSDGKSVTVRMLDADKDKQEIAQFNVAGFPTIMYMDGNGVRREYSGERTYNGITSFLNGN